MSKIYRVHTISLGCPKNRVDTENVLGGLPFATTPAATPEAADLVVVNTCSFIAPAVEESVAAILEASEAIRELSPRPVLAVLGCLPSRFGQELREGLPEVDIWGLPSELDLIPGRLAKALSAESAAPTGRLASTPPSYAYLKIAEGCDHACRYCTIPSIRGPLVSKPLDALVEESRRLLDKGASELVVVAQDVAAYGRDLGMKEGLKALLGKLLPLSGLKWLRLLYLYPSGVTDDLLAFLAGAGRPFVPYFDIPFQHIHPDMLAAMGRPKAASAETVVARVRRHFPDAALRSTFIVGLPGEKKEHFETLLRFVNEARLNHVGVFPYHREDGTPAAAMAGQVRSDVKARRVEAVMAAQREISADLLEEWVGRDTEVLVDSVHPEWPGLHVGRTWFQAPEIDGVTYVSGPGVAPGNMVTATIEEAKDYDLVGLA
ncbi:30S ribosomal protein S12 methylthiotransferase RimO [Solidesulfovibrio carbinolicus]|uniref:Ribosomal protein uS12 methylthiotransferase RimO n=1 Tax=Solidesulfovibrio carbinolicus TaxID=296842 RepID=A0A4V0YQE2_9BACT|nr:30S ribosomal protein S12 methylthiotransferase RimO [Solidesulfovibrio carbinolicus]QAZ65992.1 30S ribosomal protein S12 methylthiotransferase RimO [Solidesulfovibrio carbinolicus]